MVLVGATGGNLSTSNGGGGMGTQTAGIFLVDSYS